MNLTKNKQFGLSIIELMIAMVLGLVLTGGAMQIFISTKNSNRLQEALSRMQETGRFVVDYIAKDVRMAGYNGCASRGSISTTVIANDPPPITVDGTEAVRGYNGTATVWDPDVTASGLDVTGAIVDTDILHIQRGDSCGAYLTGNMTADNANVKVTTPNSCDFDQNEAVLITDCESADIFQITNKPKDADQTEGGDKQNLAHANSNNTDNRLSKIYGPDAEVFAYRAYTYFIANGASGEPALWTSVYGASGSYDVEELIDGVEDMQILYGEDTGGGDDYADTYVSADAVTNWEDVRSVRVNLLLRSADNITIEPRSIIFNGAAVNSGVGADNRLRLVFSATITLRNRLS